MSRHILEGKEHQMVECVLNISEGRNDHILNEIEGILQRPGETYLLHRDSGYDTNRTVFTIVGHVDGLFKAIEALINYAIDHLDIANHEGTHPRVGIVDVIPFVPLSQISKEELFDKLVTFSKEIGEKYSLPIFYYKDLCVQQPDRSLHDLRRGSIKALKAKVSKGLLVAEAGPKELHPRLGATCMTVRDFMIAYNINLKSSDLSLARKLAHRLVKERRTYSEGAGGLDTRSVKFLAWYMTEYQCCQISTNIYDIDKVTLYALYDYVEKLAAEYNLQLNGAELIGMVPLKGVVNSPALLQEAWSKLKLDSVRPFNPEEQVLEYKLERINMDINC